MRDLGFVVGLMLALVLLVGCAAPSALPLGSLGDGGSGGSSATSTGSGGDLFPTTGSGGAAACGSCVQSQPIPFERLTMVSIGAPGEVRDCPPDVAPLVGFEGVADLKSEPATCPECSCSHAWCALPEAMHVSAAKCADADGSPAVEWNASPGWEGVCTDEDAIAAGVLCGGVPCTQSLTISAPTVAPCQASAQGAASLPAPSWGTMARECLIGPLAREDCTPGEVCAPIPPEGFALCFFVNGEHPGIECPEGFERGPLVVFDTWEDDRACGPCACGDADGADCAAFVSVFSDEACGAELASLTVADEAGCVDLPSGSALGSKNAVLVVDAPGSCAPSGGEVAGAVKPIEPVTLCCQPATDPAK